MSKESYFIERERVGQQGQFARLVCRGWLAWLLVALVAANSLYYGMKVRRWVWDATTDIRFVNSVSNAIEWGRHANQVGVLNLYDVLIQKHGAEGEYEGPARFALDYPPARLLIAATWADWAQEHFPPVKGRQIVWQPAYEFTEPMLWLNSATEILATIAMFLLVYRWVRVCQFPPPKNCHWYTPWRWREEKRTRSLPSGVGTFRATLAAVLFWFCPALIWNAHAYPQWDAWLLPAFLFAVYFGLNRWWLAAGVVVGLSAMAKGQILMVFPLLVAWPLLTGDLRGVLRLMVGVAAGVAAVVWPWLLQSPATHQWMRYASAGGIVFLIVALLPRSGRGWLAARALLALLAICVMCWPVGKITGDYLIPGTTALWVGRRASLICVVGLLFVTAFLGGRRSIAALMVGWWAGVIWLTIPLLNATTAWYEIGIVYGTRHWKQLFWSHAANLGAILQARYQWRYADVVNVGDLVPWLAPLQIPIRTLMIWAYCVALALCVVGLVRQLYQRDQRLFYVLAAPWVLLFALLPQMNDRYLMWPAAIIAAAAAVEFSGLILYLVLSLIAWILMTSYMLGFVPRAAFTREWAPILARAFPDISWAVLVLAGVFLFKAMGSSRRRYWERPLNPDLAAD